MANFRRVSSDAKNRLRQRTRGFQEREPYRTAIGNMSGDDVIEIVPESGETFRKIKLNLSRASKEVGKAITYGETSDGSVLAWLADGAPKRRGRRPRGE
jgi:hypothetical protein